MGKTRTQKSATITFARELRSNQTPSEEKLWQALRDRRFENFKFRRQQVIGKYIVDFICVQKKLIIEADGVQHTPEIDQARDEYLERMGYRIMRFKNSDIQMNLPKALDDIWTVLNI